MAASDPRLSLEERYGSHVGYICVVAEAANKASGKRFLLSSDATALITLGERIERADIPDAGDRRYQRCQHQLRLATTHDFTGDGKSDIFWRDNGGDLASVADERREHRSSGGLGNVPSNWSIVGQRDFNGDGKADILWRDTTWRCRDLADERHAGRICHSATRRQLPTNWTSSRPATSTATAWATSCGRTPAATSRSG